MLQRRFVVLGLLPGAKDKRPESMRYQAQKLSEPQLVAWRPRRASADRKCGHTRSEAVFDVGVRHGCFTFWWGVKGQMIRSIRRVYRDSF